MADITISMNKNGVYTRQDNKTVYYNATAGAKTDTLLQGTHTIDETLGVATITVTATKTAGGSQDVPSSSTGKGGWIANTSQYVQLDQLKEIKVEGKKGFSSASKTYNCELDNAGPTVGPIAFYGGTYRQEKYWVKEGMSAAQVVVSATDAGSGVQNYYCSAATEPSTKGEFSITDFSGNGAKTLTCKAVDNVGNESEEKTFTYYADNTAPVISFAGYTSGIWTNKDIIVEIKADDGEGIGVDEKSYYPQKYDTITCEEDAIKTGTNDYYVADLLGNGGTASLIYKIDKQDPTITINRIKLPTWVEELEVSATFSDADGSGIDNTTAQYSLDGGKTWSNYDGAFTVYDNGVNVAFKVKDNAGNETIESFTTDNIDCWDPEIEITVADTVTIAETQSVQATITDKEPTSLLKVTQYSTDGGETWTPYNFDVEKGAWETLTCDVNNTTYIFYAEDNAGRITTETVTFKNIYAKDAKDVLIVEDKVLVDKRNHENVVVAKESIFGVTESGDLTVTGELTLNASIYNVGSLTVWNDDSKALALLHIVDDAYLYGNNITAEAITVDAGKELGITRAQYDKFLAESQFTADNAGTLYVHTNDREVSLDDVKVIIAKENLSNVKFEKDLIDIDDITFKAGKALNIDYINAYGTNGDDTIRFAKNSDVTLGSEGNLLDLRAGNDKIQVDKYAKATINSDVVRVNTVKVANKAMEANFAAIDFADGRKGSFSIGSNTAVSVGNVTGSDKKTTIEVGKDSAFVAGEINFEAKNGSVTIGNRSGSRIESIGYANKVEIKHGKKDSTWTEVNVIDSITGTEYNDKIVVGKYAKLDVGGLIDLGTGKNKIVVDNNAVVVLRADETGADSLTKFTIGKDSEAYLSSELIAKGLELNSKFGKKAAVYDIGSADVAVNFTDVETERKDDSIDGANKLTDNETFTGWLNAAVYNDGDALDEVDFFVNAEKNYYITVEPNDNITLLIGGTVAALGEKQFVFKGESVEIRTDNESGISYTLTTEKAPAVLIAAQNASKTYDGTPLTDSTICAFGDLTEGDIVSGAAEGSITDAGTAPNKVTTYVITNAAGEDVTAYYNVETQDATLTVNKANVTIASLNAEKPYDGTPLTNNQTQIVSGYFVGSEGYSANCTGSQTFVGVSKNTFTVSAVEGTNLDNYNITKVEGDLRVIPAEATITIADANFMYDGTTTKVLTDSQYSFDGIVDGDTITNVTVELTTSKIGSFNDYKVNYTIVNKDGADVTSCYDIALNKGIINVTKNNTLIYIMADSASKVYDGQELSNPSYDFDGELCTGDTLKATVVGAITHYQAGGALNMITDWTITNENGEDVTDCYSNILTNCGTLTIDKRAIELTSGSASKVYDGTALTCEKVEVTSELDFVAGEGASYSDWASITDPGSTDNSFEYALAVGTFADDYSITKKYGTLTIAALAD